MAIDQLNLVVTDTSFTLVGSRPIVRSAYQAIAPGLDAVIAEISFDQYADRPGDFDDGDAVTFSRAMSWFSMVSEWHAPQPLLDDLSYHDVSLCLRYWTFSKPGNLWMISHPLSGTFSNIKIQMDGDRPMMQGRIDAILEHVPPPPAWTWARPASPGKIAVHCTPVLGAKSYNVYSDLGAGNISLLANIHGDKESTVSVPAGAYRIRVAAVRPGVVGVMGNETLVTVGGKPIAKGGGRVAGWIKRLRKQNDE